MVSKTKKGFSEINGVRLWFLRDHHRRMYALCQVFHAFQNGHNRVPRTTFHKRLRKLHIDTKPCKLKQIHILKWLKAVPSRTSKCSLISHTDMLKLCRACGVDIGKRKGRNSAKRQSKIKAKELPNEKKKRKKKREKGLLKSKANNAEFSKRPDVGKEREKSCSSDVCEFADCNTKTLLTPPPRFVPIHDNACTIGMCRRGIGCACKQLEKPLPVQNEATTSANKTVGFSFSQPSFGYQSSFKKTVHFDIHSTAFTSTITLAADIVKRGNMRGEINVDCEGNLKERNNMDDHVHASCVVNKECNGEPTNCACCATSKPSKPEKEYFGFTGQEKDVKSWQTFGDVPDQEGTAILDGNEESEEEDIRFVNGFQFAAAAQQIRAGFKVLDSDSDQESVLSNLEINSNLSALSDLSVSSESLNSVSSSDTSLGDISKVGWRARVGPNSDMDSKCALTIHEQCVESQSIVQPCHNATSAVKYERQNSTTLDSAADLWMHQYAKEPCIRNTHNGLVHSNASIPKQVGNCKSVSTGMDLGTGKACKYESKRNAQRSHTEIHPIHKPRGVVVGGEHHDSDASAATANAKANSSTKLLVLKKDKKSWTVLPKSDRMLRENIADKRGVQLIKLGEKRKSRAIRKEEGEFQVNRKNKVRRKKERKKESEKLGVEKIVWDENGNYEKGVQIIECKSPLKPDPKSKPKVRNKTKNHNQSRRIGCKNKSGRDPRKVEELKRKLAALSSELARLQKVKGRKNVGKSEQEQKSSIKSQRLKKKRPRGERRPKQTKVGNTLPVNATFKMSEIFLLPPTLVVGGGELRPACSMSFPSGMRPPKCHPIWGWKLGGVPLPKPPRQTVTDSVAASHRK